MLRRLISDALDQATWQALDQTLARDVEALVVPTQHPHVDAMLDAARRAAVVEDVRLAQVLDVGRDEALAFVITEWVGTGSMTARLHGGPMPPADVRTVVGEVSLALEKARHRGLHHLLLTTDEVHQLDDGSVKLTGLAVAAALAGRDGAHAADTSQEATAHDTEALVALVYAGLTGYWPLDGTSALPPAPRVAGGPAAPSQIAGGVPADLDTLCAQTFSGAGAPNTPGDLAGQIAPWGRDVRPQRTASASTLPLPAILAGGNTPHRGTGATAPAPASRPARKPEPPRMPRPPRTHTPPRQVRPARAASAAEPREGLDAAFGRGAFVDGDQPAAPLLSPSPISRPPQTQTRTVLLLVASTLAVVLGLGYCGLRGLGQSSGVKTRPHVTSAPARTGVPSLPRASAPSTPAASPPAAPAPATPVTIVSASGFDPSGDGAENNAAAGLAFDGDPATSWTSENYRSRRFGGLKNGVGLLLDLGSATQVRSLAVAVGGTGSNVQLRTASAPDSLAGSTVVARAADASGTVVLRPSKPITSRYLVLWFTALAKNGNGYRAVVDEVSMR